MEQSNSSVKANEPAAVMMPLSATFYSAQREKVRASVQVNVRH